jgi:hypothetical protein
LIFGCLSEPTWKIKWSKDTYPKSQNWKPLSYAQMDRLGIGMKLRFGVRESSDC